MSAVPRDDAQRIAKYTAKVDPTDVGLKFAGMLVDMKSGFSGSMASLVASQLLVNAELGKVATIFPISYGLYQAYGNELWKLKNTTSQPALNAAAQIVKDKWSTRGCDGPTLITIALQVFNITVT